MILWKNGVCNAKVPSLCEQQGRPHSSGHTKPGCADKRSAPVLSDSPSKDLLQEAGSAQGVCVTWGYPPVRSGSLPLSSGNIFLSFVSGLHSTPNYVNICFI